MKALLLAISFLMSSIVNSQTDFYLSPTINYNISVHGFEKETTYGGDQFQLFGNTDVISAPLKGMGLGATFGFDRKKFGLDIGFNYVNSLAYIRVFDFHGSIERRERVQRLLTFNLGIWFKIFELKKSTFYTKMGAFYLLMSTHQGTFGEVNHPDDYVDIRKYFTGGSGFGGFVGLGARYQFRERVQFFSEILMKPAVYYPTYQETYHYTVNNDKQNFDKNKVELQYPYEINATSIGCNFGIRLKVF